MSRPLARLGWAIAPLVVALALALPLVGSDYAYHDDWTFLEDGLGEGLGSALTASLQQGRPLFVLVSRPVLELVDSVADLRYLRALSVAGALLLALVVGRWLRELRQGDAVAAAAAAGVVVLPPVAHFACWAVLWPELWIAAAAFAVGVRVDRRARRDPPGRPGREDAIDLAVLAATFLAYPPSAFVVLVPPAVGPLADRRTDDGRSILRGPLRLAALLALAAPVVLALQVAARRLVAPGLGASDRMRLVSLDELPGRLAWFVRGPLARAFDFVASPSEHAAAIAIALVAAAGAVAASRRRRGGVAGGLAVVAGALLLTSTAAWLPEARYLSYRTILAPTILVWLLVVVAVRELTERGAGGRRASALAGALLGLWVVATGARIIGSFVLPLVATHRAELALLREAAPRIVAERPARVLVRKVDWRAAARPGRFGEWNAFPSAADQWYAGAMIRIATREAGATFAGEVELVDAAEAAARAGEPSTFVVDYAAAFEHPSSAAPARR